MRFQVIFLAFSALALLVASQPQSSGTGCTDDQKASGCSAGLSDAGCYNTSGGGYCDCFPSYFTCLQGAGCSSDGSLWRGQVGACQQMNCTSCVPGATPAAATPGSTPRSADAINVGVSMFSLLNGFIMYLLW